MARMLKDKELDKLR